jgi:hypothetical protein
LQQGFWLGAQAGEKHVGSLKVPAVMGAAGRDFHDPAGADPAFTDGHRSPFSAQRPGDVTAVANLVICCQKGDMPLSLEMAMDLTCNVFW